MSSARGTLLGWAAVAMLIAAGVARAQSGHVEIEVVGADDEVLPGTEVAIYQNDQVVGAVIHVDEQGQARTDLPPGTYEVWAASPGSDETSQRIEVHSGETTRVRLRMKRLPPFDTLGSTFATGPGFAREDVDDLPATSYSDVRTDIFGGVAGPPQERSPGADAQNLAFDFGYTTAAWTADVVLPLVHGFGRNAATPRGARRHVVPYVRLVGGNMEVKFRQKNNADPSRDTEIKGSGLVYGGAAGLMLAMRDSSWFADFEASWMGTQDIDASRSPAVTTTVGTITSQTYTLSTEQQGAQAALGYVVSSRVAVSAGARWSRETLDYSGKLREDFSAALGSPVESEVVVVTHHTDDFVEALLGLDVRFTRHLFGRLQASSDGSASSVRASATYAFGR